MFSTFFNDSQLLPNSISDGDFTTHDAQTYVAFRDKLKVLDLTEEQRFTIAINATVACNYMSPLAAKSWYFQKQSNTAKEFYDGELVQLFAVNAALYIVLDSGLDTSIVMLIDKYHQIDNERKFQFGKIIKVHNDRLEKLY